MFVVLKIHNWRDVTISCLGQSLPINSPDKSIGFLEVFATREDAVEEYGDDVRLVKCESLPSRI